MEHKCLMPIFQTFGILTTWWSPTTSSLSILPWEWNRSGALDFAFSMPAILTIYEMKSVHIVQIFFNNQSYLTWDDIQGLDNWIGFALYELLALNLWGNSCHRIGVSLNTGPCPGYQVRLYIALNHKSLSLSHWYSHIKILKFLKCQPINGQWLSKYAKILFRCSC